MFDLSKARADTPAVENGIYLNNAGCSLMPQPVIDAVQNYFTLEASIGGYPAMLQETGACDAVYASVASLINAKPNEIALNLKESGSFVPGIRPGENTSAYINGILARITLCGAVFLCIIAPSFRAAGHPDGARGRRRAHGSPALPRTGPRAGPSCGR